MRSVIQEFYGIRRRGNLNKLEGGTKIWFRVQEMLMTLSLSVESGVKEWIPRGEERRAGAKRTFLLTFYRGMAHGSC
jgi:hypothetical protein